MATEVAVRRRRTGRQFDASLCSRRFAAAAAYMPENGFMMPRRNSLNVESLGPEPQAWLQPLRWRAGHAVTVFEKHGALAPLGAGLLIQPQGVAALEALGVGATWPLRRA